MAIKSHNTNIFRNGVVYEDLNAVIQETKQFSTGSLPWMETFTDNQDQAGISYQVAVPYDILIKGKSVRKVLYTKVTCRGAVAEQAEKLKLKPGSCIRFTGEYGARRGAVKWFTSFEILHPDFLEKIKELDVVDPTAI